MKKQLLLLVMMLLPMVASADAVEIDGIWYNLDSTEKQAEVAKKPSGYYSDAIVIPEKVTDDGTEYSVTSIGVRAFSGCSGLTSITIPNSVTSIGYMAFALCSGLTSVDIPGSVTSIGEYAFFECSGLTSVTIEYGVPSIGECAFYGCSGLTSVDIPGSVKSIGKQAFYICRGLTSVSFGSGVTSIGMHAFSGCSGLILVSIPASVTSIDYGAFADCSGLTSVTIGNGVTSIGDLAFENCEYLTSVTIGSGVREIGGHAFSLCPKLTDVTCKAVSVPNTSSNAFDNSYPDQATLHVPAEAVVAYRAAYPWSRFKNVVALTEDNQDNTVQYAINDEGTAAIVSVNHSADGKYVVPSSVTIDGAEYTVTEIGANAFSGCKDLTAVIIPETIVAIGDHAFSGCSGLTMIIIGKGVTSIGNQAFANVGTAAARTRGESTLIVNCYAESVPQTAGDAFENTPIKAGALVVQDYLLDNYKTTSPWSGFGKIIGFEEATGIYAITAESAGARIYDMQGNQLDKLQKGVNIIRMNNGTTKKVLMK